jgi:hypothetical protein
VTVPSGVKCKRHLVGHWSVGSDQWAVVGVRGPRLRGHSGKAVVCRLWQKEAKGSRGGVGSGRDEVEDHGEQLRPLEGRIGPGEDRFHGLVHWTRSVWIGGGNSASRFVMTRAGGLTGSDSSHRWTL